MRIALAGAGAFGEKHLDGLKLIDGVEITSIISRTAEQAAAVAEKYGAKHSSTELADALARDDVDARVGDRSSCAAAPWHSCSCGGRNRFARPSG